MELIKKQIHTNRVGKSIVDQFYIDDDINVPDSKDDIGRIVMGKGTIAVEEMQRMENYIRVTGKLHYAVLYVTDGGDPHLASLEGKHPFEEMVYIEGREGEQYLLRNSTVEFSASLIHSRKISLKAMAEIEIGWEKMEDVSLPTDVEEEAPLYKKTKNVQMLTLQTTKKDTYRIKEEMKLPGTKENIGTLLWTDVESRKLDTKLGEDELNVSGELMVFCLYESPEGKNDWMEQIIPYNGRVECSDADGSMFHHVHAALEDVNVEARMDEDGEMRILGIEGTLALHMNFYREESVELLEDLYSLQKQCLFDTTEVVCEELLMQNQSKCKVTERLSLPELKTDVLQILHARGAIQVEHADRTGEGIRVEGILHLSFLYLRGDDAEPYGSWQGMIPFEHQIECKEMPEETVYNMEQHIEQLQITLVGSESVEIKGILTFDTFLRRPVKVWTMENVREEPLDLEQLEKRPSIVGHIVQRGEDLWQLAKQYMTTKEGIMEVNGMQNENVKEGDKLLIFKENMSIL